MPTYKILRHGEQELRDRRVHGRMRLVTLLISGLLFLATAVLMLSHLVRGPA